MRLVVLLSDPPVPDQFSFLMQAIWLPSKVLTFYIHLVVFWPVMVLHISDADFTLMVISSAFAVVLLFFGCLTCAVAA